MAVVYFISHPNSKGKCKGGCKGLKSLNEVYQCVTCLSIYVDERHFEACSSVLVFSGLITAEVYEALIARVSTEAKEAAKKAIEDEKNRKVLLPGEIGKEKLSRKVIKF